MAELTITVPTGESCKRCPYLESQYKEVAYGCGQTTFVCEIFNVKIFDGNKCDECYLKTEGQT